MRKHSVALLAAIVSLAAATQGSASQTYRSRTPLIRTVIRLPGQSGIVDVARHTAYQPAYQNNRNYVVAFDWLRRRTTWRTAVGSFWSPLGVGGGTVVCAAGRADRPDIPSIGLDSETGRIRWERKMDRLIAGYPAGHSVIDDRIYQVSKDRLWCLRADSGKVIWQRHFPERYGNYAPHPPVIRQSSLYTQMMGRQTDLSAIGTRDGSIRWQKSFPGNISYETTMFHEVGPVLATLNRVIGIVPTAPQKNSDEVSIPPVALCCWRASDGKLLWQQKTPWSERPMLSDGGRVFVLETSGKGIRAYSAENGRLLWSYLDRTRGLERLWGLYGGTLITHSLGAAPSLIGIDAVRGRRQWRIRFPRSENIEVVTLRPDLHRIFAIADSDQNLQSKLYVIDGP